MSDWWNQPIRPSAQTGDAAAPAPACPWCGASAAADAERCPSCGASMSQREDLAIPGVTTVDPELLRKSAASAAASANSSRDMAMRVGGRVGGITGTLAVGAAFLAADALAGRKSASGGVARDFDARLAEADRALAATPPAEPTPPAETPPAEATPPAEPGELTDWSI